MTKYYPEQEAVEMMMGIIVDAIRTAKICNIDDPSIIQHGVVYNMASKALSCNVEIPDEVKNLVGNDSMNTMMELHERFGSKEK